MWDWFKFEALFTGNCRKKLGILFCIKMIKNPIFLAIFDYFKLAYRMIFLKQILLDSIETETNSNYISNWVLR